MGSLLLFLSSFIHYLWVFAISVVLIVAACFIGVKWTKSKNASEAALQAIEEDQTAKETQS
ncbi:MAG: hypothetical protein PHS74_02075 [Lachnospiraceae bacterium]|nr:hypothetical protein [Lachnospiraceae bacterium]